MSAGSLATEIRDGLRANADPALAADMAAYMKVAENHQLGFAGVRRPVGRRLTRSAAKPYKGEPDVLVSAATSLWDDADVREQRYAAQDLLALPSLRGRIDLLDLHQRMAVEGAWWDHVDEVSHRASDLVATHPIPVGDRMRAWSHDPDRWLRRLAILGQLGRKDEVDRDLLTAVIEPNVSDPEFFVRKAIGWALREVARHDPSWVVAFVDAHDLSPLSRREALKHVG